MNYLLTWQWILVIASSLALFFIAPLARTAGEFFSASSQKGKQPGALLLTSSLVISWIFAKSITNAANLGLAYGFVGGVAYAVYYLSFLVAGVVIYQLRTRGGFPSIHAFLRTRYGTSAVTVFSLLISFRLFNEVWSNTMVIGTYFGEKDSSPYYLSILVFTALTLAYGLKGGLKSSLLTDLIQMVLFGVLLFVILGVLLPQEQGSIGKFVSSGEWRLSQGLYLLFAAFIQIFSYPFHDPVLTDRGFISSPRTTLRSYAWATVIGFICILLFSFVGIYAGFQGLQGEAPVVVSQSLGVGMMLVMNLIMITSAASTLDSTFSSFSKLVVVDVGRAGKATIRKGRLVMVGVAVAGTLPVFLSPEVLDATTISGTMVIGLAPVFLFWNRKAPRAAFHGSVGVGLLAGLLLALDLVPEQWVFAEGAYAKLFVVNLLGSVGCFAVFFGTGFFGKRDEQKRNPRYRNA